MSDYEFLIYEQNGPVVTLTMNRPEALNALSRRAERTGFNPRRRR
jgi:enoyl-CoA hydratase/carnithine racemase